MNELFRISVRLPHKSISFYANFVGALGKRNSPSMIPLVAMLLKVKVFLHQSQSVLSGLREAYRILATGQGGEARKPSLFP